MVFDTRGRRKHVVRVVYAILAVLMGASLFLVVGPINIGSLLGNSTTTGNTAGIFEEQTARIEHRLKQSPEDPDLLNSLTRARISLGGAKSETNATTGVPTITGEARVVFEEAFDAWKKYEKQAGGETSPGLALIVAKAYFGMALNSHSYEEAFENLDGAAAAQRHIVETQRTLNSLTSLASYEFLAGNFAAAEKATKEAESLRDLEEPEEDDRRTGHCLPQAGQEDPRRKEEVRKVAEGQRQRSPRKPARRARRRQLSVDDAVEA